MCLSPPYVFPLSSVFPPEAVNNRFRCSMATLRLVPSAGTGLLGYDDIRRLPRLFLSETFVLAQDHPPREEHGTRRGVLVHQLDSWYRPRTHFKVPSVEPIMIYHSVTYHDRVN